MTVSERILEDYEIDLAEAVQHYERPEDLDLPALRRELSDTEKELNRLGPVNMAAIDELKEVEAREGFLAQQYTDLQDAKEKLDGIIDHINTTSRKMFQRSFKVIRKNFQELFRKLFGGGKADLILELDPDNPDVLEAGLEIIAQPPGKQPKSITLLSGGEKALTAIALLFAVYRTKPSPFVFSTKLTLRSMNRTPTSTARCWKNSAHTPSSSSSPTTNAPCNTPMPSMVSLNMNAGYRPRSQ